METLAFSILILFGLVGFAAIFFTTFGTFVILLGATMFAFITNFLFIDVRTLIVLLILYLVGELSEYLFVIIGGKKFGASNLAVVGALIGAIVGALVGPFLLGIGLLLSVFLGIFLGAFLVELSIHNDLSKSIKAGIGGVLGRLASIAVKLIIAVLMFYIITSRILLIS